MLKNIFKYSFSVVAENTEKVVYINLDIEGQVTKHPFPLYSRLAQKMQKLNVPLEFKCGFAGKCGTCAVRVSNELQAKLNEDQPILMQQRSSLNQNSYDHDMRLSCQLRVQQYMQGSTLQIV